MSCAFCKVNSVSSYGRCPVGLYKQYKVISSLWRYFENYSQNLYKPIRTREGEGYLLVELKTLNANHANLKVINHFLTEKMGIITNSVKFVVSSLILTIKLMILASDCLDEQICQQFQDSHS